MHKDRERDNALDRLLRQTMPGLGHDAAAPCPDGETVAAWAEHALRGTEAAAIEAHLAQCARCQALLAAFVRATPAPEVTRSLSERWHLRWLVPLGAAATAVAIWVAVPSNQPPTPATFDARTERESRQEAVALGEPQQQAPTFPTRPVAPAAPQQSAAAAPDAGTRSEAAKAAPQVGALDAREGAPAVGVANQDASANSAQPSRSADTTATASAGAVGGADRARAEPAAAAAAPPAAPSAPAERGGPALFREEIALPQVVSPDPARRWRITAAGQVERSVSGGAAWERAVIDPPATLTAGSSPDPLVCWFVGRGGAVYVTTNGVQFVRVPFPVTVDLAAVRTPDARSATVTSSDGLSWRTTDLGRSWTGPTR